MACSVLAMAIKAPTDLRWADEDLTFYWDNDPAAEYSTYTLDGVQRGFMCYHGKSYSPDPQLLSPGNHTFCVYCCDAKLNCSDWSCITISIEDTIRQELHTSPAVPSNLYWENTDSTSVTLFWSSEDSSAVFSVFLDEVLVGYNLPDTSFLFVNLSPGMHLLGVCACDSLGYVSDVNSILISYNLHLQPTVLLQDAYWSFETPESGVTHLQILTDNANAEYAYQGNSAAVLQSTFGTMSYLILPAISDVQNYDSLEISFMARGGYWSIMSQMWARMADIHRLQIGSMPYIPRPEEVAGLLKPLFDTILPYANVMNFEDYQADSLSFWREVRVPLTDAQRYIVIYTESTKNNYVIVDEVRVSQIASGNTSNTDVGYPCLPVVPTEKILMPDGQLYIRKGNNLYNVHGILIR